MNPVLLVSRERRTESPILNGFPGRPLIRLVAMPVGRWGQTQCSAGGRLFRFLVLVVFVTALMLFSRSAGSTLCTLCM